MKNRRIFSEYKGALTRGAGEAPCDPGGPGGAVRGPVDLLEVDEPRSLLLEVGEHGRQQPPAEARRGADCREGANSLQEVIVGVGRVGVWKQTLETDFTENGLEDSDIVRIAEASWVNVLHCRGRQPRHGCGHGG